jgi:hypothetical protein
MAIYLIGTTAELFHIHENFIQKSFKVTTHSLGSNEIQE